MKPKQIAADLLHGAGAAFCAFLFTAAAFAGSELLIAAVAAAAALYFSILLLRTPEHSAWKRRSLTALLLYPLLLGLCYLTGLWEPLAEFGNAEFADLAVLFVLYIPGAFVLLIAAAILATKPEKHPVFPVPLICVFYLLYAVVQIDFFHRALSAHFSISYPYAHYARSGFFELCTVAVINLAVIFALNRRIRKGDSPRPKLLTGGAAALCLFTMYTALAELAKLTAYIRVRGLTMPRVCALWGAVLTGLVFLVLLAKQFVKKLPAAAVMTAACAVLLGGLFLSHPARRIAEYNITGYENGTLDELDVRTLCGLSDEAYTVMAVHQETLKGSDYYGYYLEQAEARSHGSGVQTS